MFIIDLWTVFLYNDIMRYLHVEAHSGRPYWIVIEEKNKDNHWGQMLNIGMSVWLCENISTSGDDWCFLDTNNAVSFLNLDDAMAFILRWA